MKFERGTVGPESEFSGACYIPFRGCISGACSLVVKERFARGCSSPEAPEVGARVLGVMGTYQSEGQRRGSRWRPPLGVDVVLVRVHLELRLGFGECTAGAASSSVTAVGVVKGCRELGRQGQVKIGAHNGT